MTQVWMLAALAPERAWEAVNDSQDSSRARRSGLVGFEFGLDLAQKCKASLTVLAVVRTPTTGDEEETQALIETGQKRLGASREKLAKKVQAAGIKLDRRIAVGHPAEQIIEFAEVNKIDLIVMGHRRRNALGRWLIGSVSERVMDHAPRSVIVVKNGRIK